MARRNKNEEREIARERVARLVALAEAAARGGRLDRAARYGDLAWRVKTTYQLRGSAVDKRLCRKCRAFLSASTSRVRLRDGVRIVTCLGCGQVRRTPYSVAPAKAGLTRNSTRDPAPTTQDPR